MKKFTLSSFLWKYIKPYKWHYAVILIGPLMFGVHTLVHTYCLKLIIDQVVTQDTFVYREFLMPVGLLLANMLVVNLIFRSVQYVKWKAIPAVNRAILLDSYNYVQHHSYTFFQNNFTGSISSKLKGLLDGHNRFFELLGNKLFMQGDCTYEFGWSALYQLLFRNCYVRLEFVFFFA